MEFVCVSAYFITSFSVAYELRSLIIIIIIIAMEITTCNLLLAIGRTASSCAQFNVDYFWMQFIFQENDDRHFFHSFTLYRRKKINEKLLLFSTFIDELLQRFSLLIIVTPGKLWNV